MTLKGIRIWIVGEQINWDDQVSVRLGERCVTILSAAFAELIDEGVIYITVDEFSDTTEGD